MSDNGFTLEKYSGIPAGKAPCPYTGMRRASLRRFLFERARGAVRTVRLATPGAKRGKVLFHVGDALDYLNRLADEQAGQAPEAR